MPCDHSLDGQCLNATWFNLGGHYLNATWHLPSQNGICLIKMMFDQSKNHLTVILTSQSDESKVHSPITMDKFKTTCPK